MLVRKFQTLKNNLRNDFPESFLPASVFGVRLKMCERVRGVFDCLYMIVFNVGIRPFFVFFYVLF